MQHLVLIKENKIISYLRDITLPLRVGLTFGIFAITFLLWLQMLYLPILQEVNQCEADLKTVKGDNTALSKLALQTSVLENEVGNISKKLKSKTMKKCDMNTIFDLLYSNRLNCIKFIRANKKNEYYTLIFHGEFEKIVSFFDQISKHNLAVDINDFYLSSIDNKKIEFSAHLKIN